MATSRDYALIVGINEYDWNILEPLKGPRNDAKNFMEWLLSPTGGKIPKKNILPYLLIADHGEEPKSSDVVNRVMKMIKLSRDGETSIGRRLYIFLAGHGVASELDEAGLLTADANQLFPLHIVGSRYANLFAGLALFEEVILIMDCCRFSGLVSENGSVFNFGGKYDDGGAYKVKRFHAYSTGFGRAAREKRFGREVHGIFSHILMDGLRGGAVDGQGQITVRNLKRFIDKKLSKLMAAGDDQDPDMDGDDDIVLVDGLPPAKAKVIVDVPLDDNHQVEALSGIDLQPVEIIPQKLGKTKTMIWLPVGKLYIIQVRNAQRGIVGQGSCTVEDAEEVLHATIQAS